MMMYNSSYDIYLQNLCYYYSFTPSENGVPVEIETLIAIPTPKPSPAHYNVGLCYDLEVGSWMMSRLIITKCGCDHITSQQANDKN